MPTPAATPRQGASAKDAKGDAYTWRPLWCALLLVVATTAAARLSDFVSSGSEMLLFEGLLLVAAMVSLGVTAAFLLKALTALTRRHLHRSLSFGCAAAALPLGFLAGHQLPVLDPYFWYVVSNQSHFERIATSNHSSGLPAFAILEERDTSPGLAIGEPIFTAIVYDASDELRRPLSERSPDWQARNGIRLSTDGSGKRLIYAARHLRGHFYLVTSTYP